MKPITENHIEYLSIEILQSLGWDYVNGVEIAPTAEHSERESYEQILLLNRLRRAVEKINPDIPEEYREEAIKKLDRINTPNLIENNKTFHTYLTEKVKVSYQEDGFDRSYEVALIDFDNPDNNEYLAVNQYIITEKNQNIRTDVLLFINGIPLVLIELKNALDENATIEKAYKKLQSYKAITPSLFTFNEICVISDGHEAKAGSLSADQSRFMSWKSIDGDKEASRFIPQIETLIKGMFNKTTLLDLIKNFVLFEEIKKTDPRTGLAEVETIKILTAYHQYYAVNKAVNSTIDASKEGGNRKGGVIWHTQGSGKSLSMVFYAGKLITSEEMHNPTILVITDRNDLDQQLFDTFASSKQLLRQEPVQAENMKHVKELLRVASGGIVFSTIQKFAPDEEKSVYEELSDRRNIVVIVDEAHRSQYGFEARFKEIKEEGTNETVGTKVTYGLAKYLRDALPNATYIGFTGTPIELKDKNTKNVFGDYVDRYDISQAVEDGATVRIFYESRLAKVTLTDEGKKLLDELDKELEQNEELTEKEKSKGRWARLEAIVGNTERLENLAHDIVNHFEKRQEILKGKGMIVTMSRKIAAKLYEELIKLKPEWHSDDLMDGALKLIITSSTDDGPQLQKYKTTKKDRQTLADRMKDPDDMLQIVIVCDMWLTGFDVPPLHTMYIDKLMRGHNLMQAIARVNRVFKDKPGGLIVDYLGIGTRLKKALSFYSEAGGLGEPAETQEQAVEMMLEKLEVVRQMFKEESKSHEGILVEEPKAYYGGTKEFNYERFFEADDRGKLSIILQAEEHILGLENGKERFIREVTALSQAFALAMPHDEALKIKEEVGFYQAVKARLVKFVSGGAKKNYELESAIRNIIDSSLSSEQVIDIFDAAGLSKPDISGLEILSDEFLAEVQGMKHKNIAFETLKRLLNGEIRKRSRTNLVKSKKFMELLQNAIKKYQNNLLTTAEIIQELIKIAKELKESDKEAEKLGLNQDEVAFYNALSENESAKEVLGDEQLKVIAVEVADKVRNNATIDWTLYETARARLMVLVKRTLNKYGYPPDMQKAAIDLVMKQAELMAENVVEENG